ncbi:acyltransferase [Paraflavisolibacter sp. H34]|uniref:acyltransferase family protein n=1 Tax=Huijunlia imazamoxiresistens TaxID=3127457 RepID=UPI00301B380E
MHKRIFFKGLSELRALAALAVLFHHIELYKSRDHINGLYDTALAPFIDKLGKNGVYLFFVLSGFLITYLLLAEKERNGFIDIAKFYVRRILRIWPVYYTVLLFSFFLLPLLAQNIPAMAAESGYYHRILLLQNDFYTPFFLFLFFLPNLALTLRYAVVGAAQSWSVGVEEQFYLLWPHLVNKVRKTYLPYLFVSIILVLTAFKWVSAGNEFAAIKMVRHFLASFVIELMAVGALGAYFLYYHQERLQKLFTRPALFIANLAIIAALLLRPVHHLILGFFFCTLILFIIQDSNRIKFNLRSKYLDRLGVLSYGIYMYHPIVMYFCFALVHGTGMQPKGSLGYNLLLYTLIGGLSIGLSYLSYFYFESWFLKLKDKKFTNIKSGRAVEEYQPAPAGVENGVAESAPGKSF